MGGFRAELLTEGAGKSMHSVRVGRTGAAAPPVSRFHQGSIAVPSFDIVSQIDLQEVDNAVNNVLKEVDTRFDFRGSNTEITFNRKDKRLNLVTGDEMKIKALRDMLITHFTRRKVDSRVMEYGDPEGASKGRLKQEIKLKEGIDKETARTIVKMIKDAKLKVQASIQDDQVRVTGKKIDDLQTVIQLMKDSKIDMPLQYVNMKS